MAPRRALSSISGNIRRGKDLTSDQRCEIVGRFDAAQKIAEIALKIKKRPSVVHDTIRLRKKRKSSVSLPGSGRPSKVNDRVKHRIVVVCTGALVYS